MEDAERFTRLESKMDGLKDDMSGIRTELKLLIRLEERQIANDAKIKGIESKVEQIRTSQFVERIFWAVFALLIGALATFFGK